MRTGTRTIDDSGIGIGVATEDGDVHDDAGVHIASVDATRVVSDRAGVRFGRLVHDPTHSGPATAERAGSGVR